MPPALNLAQMRAARNVTTLETARLTIRLVAPEDAAGAIAYDLRNAEHLQRWEPRRDDPSRFEIETRASSLATRRREADADRGYAFFARAHEGGDDIVASINLSNVIRGALQGCHLGYSVDAAHEGMGIASEAVRAVVTYAFQSLRLHRVMANYHPTNERSGALLRRLGFVHEGYARDYLFIDGAWRDSILTSLVNPESEP